MSVSAPPLCTYVTVFPSTFACLLFFGLCFLDHRFCVLDFGSPFFFCPFGFVCLFGLFTLFWPSPVSLSCKPLCFLAFHKYCRADAALPVAAALRSKKPPDSSVSGARSHSLFRFSVWIIEYGLFSTLDFIHSKINFFLFVVSNLCARPVMRQQRRQCWASRWCTSAFLSLLAITLTSYTGQRSH